MLKNLIQVYYFKTNFVAVILLFWYIFKFPYFNNNITSWFEFYTFKTSDEMITNKIENIITTDKAQIKFEIMSITIILKDYIWKEQIKFFSV